MILVALCAAGVFAQAPVIYNRSVVNAASYMPAGIPGGAIARGSIFSIFGARLGPSSSLTATSYPLATSLGNVTISVTGGGTTVNALPIYVSPGQINAIMPSNAPLGTVSLQVSFNNARSNFVPVRVAANAFGIFTANGGGTGPGILQNYIDASTQPINAPLVTARPGQAVTLWGTGLGATSAGDNVAPPAQPIPGQVELFVGNVPAQILYNGRAPCCAGTDQIVFTVPDRAPVGCWVPVYVRTGGTTVSNVASIAIEASGLACTTDVLPQVTSVLVRGGKLAEITTARIATRHDTATRTPVDTTADYHTSFALYFTPGPFPYDPLLVPPPAGTCTVQTASGDLLRQLQPGIPADSVPLDLGSIFSLTGPRGARTLTPTYGGRTGYLGGAISNGILSSTLFLDPGSYTVGGAGGVDVGVFSTGFDIPQPLAWTNRDQLTRITRAQGLTVSFTGAAKDQVVLLVGYGVDLPTNSSAKFTCASQPGASSVSVPAAILANVPATRPNILSSKGVLYLVGLPSPQNLNAPGADVGLAFSYSASGKSVIFQ